MANLTDTTIFGNLQVKRDTHVAGDVYGDRVFGAVFNDIADFVNIDDDVEIIYGRAYVRDNGKVRLSKKSDKGILGIASDTFGFGVGNDTEKNQIPIAIGGWVLAEIDKVYPFATSLTYSSEGKLTKASILTRLLYTTKIVATFDREEKELEWNGIKVNGRHWVKVV